MDTVVHKSLINKYFDLRSLDNTCAACLELMQIRGGSVDISSLQS